MLGGGQLRVSNVWHGLEPRGVPEAAGRIIRNVANL